MSPHTSPSDFRNALMEGIDQVVFIYETASNQFSYLNPAFEQVFQRQRESIQPLSLLEIVHPEDQEYVREVYEDLLKGETKKRAEFRILLPDQTERWLRVKPLLLEEVGKRVIAGVAEDITEFKQFADIEQKYSAKKNAVLTILSHDLAGPIGQIQALSSLIATRVKPYGDEDLSKVINIITETSKRSLRLIQDFVEQEFLESIEANLVKGRVNIVERLQEIVSQYQDSQQSTAISFKLVSSDPSIYAEVDSVKFFQVINNLISNAIKFTKDDGTITIGVEDKEQEDTVVITVEDNGIGIPKKYHQGLFDKFTKARRPGLRQEPSVGLGMSIIKTIVEWHKGRIWFESEENKGTKFYIEIPKR
jgi:two-component system, OmpR family, sensor histidine kinase VicK